ncbi:hypothetical protein D3C78_1159150 [compost metagenome]
MGHGPQGLDIQFSCQVDVAGTDKACREIVLEHPHDFFLNLVGEASAGAEVCHLQLSQFIAAGMRPEPVELAVELVTGLAELDLGVAVAVAHFADDCQQRHLEEDYMQPGSP